MAHEQTQPTQAFKRWDIDEDNQLSAEDIRTVLKSSGLPDTDEDIAAMIRGLDPRGTGVVSWKHFLEAYSRKHAKSNGERPSDEVSEMTIEFARKRATYNPLVLESTTTSTVSMGEEPSVSEETRDS